MIGAYDEYGNVVDLVAWEKQIREDAIEEYKDRLLELCDCGIERAYCTGANCLKCMDNSVDYSSIIDLAEELMEKKNEHDAKEEADIWLCKKGGGE